MSAALPSRARVLSLYRTALRKGKNWPGPPKEAVYIRTEAQRLFRRNRPITDASMIETKVFEAESRIELAMHYRIPYPRLYHASAPPAEDVDEGEEIIPAYMHSYFDGLDDELGAVDML
eukprot:TRINITY_DN7025_c0_g1_i1.p2 TRINITY_DN7025_c0_g1~~TRINITY_DN7025_c0_g1_i1.p2  ORF type:complete len:119 (+),score=27.13 TRINITY_DN7025_c0_g1_i1:627-983(+)